MPLEDASAPLNTLQVVELPFAAALSRGVDHLFDHLSVGVQAAPCGSTEPPRAGIGFLRGSMGVRGGLTAPTQVDYESEGRRFESCRARSYSGFQCD